MNLVHVEAIRAAAERVRPVLRATPCEHSDGLSEVAGRPVIVKPEHLQRMGSFKLRGAYNFMRDVPDGVPVVAASAGNHGQGVALAARLTGHRARVFMPRLASLPKVAATADEGAEVVQLDGGVDDCIAAAREFAARDGAVFVPPFDDPAVIAGQGTIGLEIACEAPDAQVVVVPIGGGGLISGIAAALRAELPAVRVVGVEAAGATSMSQSVRAGHRVEVSPRTMADGVALRAPSDLTLAHCTQLVDEIVQVSEEEISRAVLLLVERQKTIVEPAGAMALAAIVSGAVAGDGPAVALLSGGNVDPLLVARLIDHGLAAAGRFVALRVVIPDLPGTLAALLGVVAATGANLLTVEHHREGMAIPVGAVSVTITVETRDHAHQVSLRDALTGAGYGVDEVR